MICKQHSLNNFTAKRKIQQVVHFKTMAKNDRLLHPYQQHTITARLPDGHMCSTKLGIIDDDCKFLIYVCILQEIYRLVYIM